MMNRKPSNVLIFLGWFPLTLAVLHLGNGAASKAPNGSYISSERRLYNHLMEDYKKFIRPVNDSRETITVKLSLDHFTIDDLDEKNQVFMLKGYFQLRWKDAGLVWNYKDFNKLYDIQLSISDLWYPDLTIFNSKSTYFTPPKHHTALILARGRVIWHATINIKTHCELDLSEFPFDEQVCRVVFASWMHSELAINLTSSDLDTRAENLLNRALSQNLEWKLMKVTVERNEKRFPCCKEDIFPDITYKFTIRRRITFATHLFVGPSVMLCLVTPVVFLLPPGSGEKMMLGIGVLVADTLLLGELIDYIPMAHPNLPLIARYFVGNIVMASLSLAISAIIIGFWDKSTSRLSGPPAFFRLILLGPLATMLCLKKDELFSVDKTTSDGALEINPEGEGETESTSEVDPQTERKRRFMTNSYYLCNAARSEWRQLATVFDRLFFVIYCVIIAILMLSFARYI